MVPLALEAEHRTEYEAVRSGMLARVAGEDSRKSRQPPKHFAPRPFREPSPEAGRLAEAVFDRYGWRGEVSASDAAEAAGIPRGTAARLIDELRDLGCWRYTAPAVARPAKGRRDGTTVVDLRSRREREGRRMRATFDRKALADAFNLVKPAAPTRSPKPILQNLLLTVGPDGATLVGTDLDVAIRANVLGADFDRPGSVVLPTAKVDQILGSSGDDAIRIECTDQHVEILGARSRFKLPLEDPALFPDVPTFAASSPMRVDASALRMAIARTIYAIETASARYALGGVLLEVDGSRLLAVGTDGKRLARATLDVESAPDRLPQAVVPPKALKLISAVAAWGDGDLELDVTAEAVQVRTPRASIYSRLVEGRYPKYRDIFPDPLLSQASTTAGELRRAIQAAAVTTTEESRGVDMDLRPGMLTLSAEASDSGASRVETPVDYEGEALTATIDVRYILDALRSLGDDTPVALGWESPRTPMLLTAEGFEYVLMPLTRDRS